MIKETMEFVDFNGNTRKEDFYFHLSEAELTEWELTLDGGLSGAIQKIMDSQDTRKTIEIFKELITKSYGVKSEDGRRFVKNQEELDSFMQTQAYSDLYMKLATDDKAASEFINGILPKNLEERIKKLSDSAKDK